MKTLAHSLLVWLLLLALPFQGVAAAGMLPCAPVAVMPAAAAPMGMAGHDHAAMLAQATRADIHCAPQATPAAAPDCHDGDAHHGKGSCASCCTGAAMAPAALALPPALASPAFVSIPFRAGHVPSVDPTLPERPPRLPS